MGKSTVRVSFAFITQALFPEADVCIQGQILDTTAYGEVEFLVEGGKTKAPPPPEKR